MVKPRVRFAIWWRNAGMGLRLSVLLLGLTALSMLLYWRRPDEEMARSGGGVLVFILVNLNVVILGVLAFLIGRNVVKLIFDRRRGIVGSKLRSRLVAAFVGLTLIPTTIIFVLASGLLTKAMEGWFSSQVETSVNSSLEVARSHYSWVKDFVRDFARRTAREIQQRSELAKSATALRSYIDIQRKDWNLFSISVLKPDATVIAAVRNAAGAIENFAEPPPDQNALNRALKSESGVLFEEKAASQFIRAYVPLRYDGKQAILMATIRISPDLSQAAAAVSDSFREYEQLKMLKRPIKSGYILTLSMITGLILFSAIWIAFYIARELVVPIQRLAEATKSIARGRFDIQIREKGDDEMSLLVRSFNQMTSEIRASRQESERRRVFIETILSNLAVGVVGIDNDHRITTVNAAAARIFALNEAQSNLNKGLVDVLREDVLEQLKPLLDEIEESSRDHTEEPQVASERQIQVSSQGRELKVLCTAGQIRDDAGLTLGYVLLFDDITDLSKAQQMAAWREVAQRIAHEIKNPLTPIQLSAQRLAKLFSEPVATKDSSGGEAALTHSASEVREKVLDCSQTIVEHVDSIKRLANEFSRFARMPQSEMAAVDLNSLINDTILHFAENHPDVVFQFVADNTLPQVEIDREQIRRILINLVDNAIAAIHSILPADRQEKTSSGNIEGARVSVKTTFDRRRKIATLEVADNGPGIKKGDKSKVFEPYFTTKKGGTGLGLAIVTSVVSDHQGVIRVYDNFPHGAKFVIDLPVSHGKPTQRRFAQGSA